MDMPNDAEPEWVKVSERLPEPGVLVVYRTSEYSFAGKLTASGEWLDHLGRAETNEVIEWRPL